jgi:hypothetical protein
MSRRLVSNVWSWFEDTALSRTPRRQAGSRFPSQCQLLEHRQLLTFTASATPVNTELQIYNGMGVHSVQIALPPDALSFQSLSFEPLLGTVVPDGSDPLKVRYDYNSSGVDAFGISYLDGNGVTQTQIVSVVIFDDYTSEVVLDEPDAQSEKDFLGSLYNAFINPPQGSGGTSGSPGAGSGTGNGSGACHRLELKLR